jgi:pimeloyl-ACP methyl ester carboxylesterase
VPAHGLSKIDQSVKSTEDILSNVLQFIEQMGFNEYSIIGHSYGGYLAQGIVRKQSNHVKGICLVAPALHLEKRTLPEKVIIREKSNFLDHLDTDIKSAFELLMVVQNEKTLHSFMDEVHPGRLLANREFLASNWKETGYYLSVAPFLEKDSMPQSLLIIVGKQDAICGYKDSFGLTEKFPHSSHIVLDQAGHMLAIEKREIVQELVLDWLSSTKE